MEIRKSFNPWEKSLEMHRSEVVGRSKSLPRSRAQLAWLSRNVYPVAHEGERRLVIPVGGLEITAAQLSKPTFLLEN